MMTHNSESLCKFVCLVLIISARTDNTVRPLIAEKTNTVQDVVHTLHLFEKFQHFSDVTGVT